MRCPKCNCQLFIDIQGDSYSHYISDSDNDFRATCDSYEGCGAVFSCKMKLVSIAEVSEDYWRNQ